jgi:hypothetical protein
MAHIVIRNYANATALFDELAKHESEVRELITTVPGFVRCGLVRTSDGGFSITTCETKEGTDESIRRVSSSPMDKLRRTNAHVGRAHEKGWHDAAPCSVRAEFVLVGVDERGSGSQKLSSRFAATAHP